MHEFEDTCDGEDDLEGNEDGVFQVRTVGKQEEAADDKDNISCHCLFCDHAVGDEEEAYSAKYFKHHTCKVAKVSDVCKVFRL
ncbi:MAG: hypothetical protein CO030_01970 [Candidatus Magasanikbacteria bacterium CG_4_9_14_0_2_um_filter_42_11]|uniref:Uncharacterized protein n=1 Tax=Candidatus Magasanikbacteria bacterium CG_4_9_14_0_2_um_filter_42_11 TaxID=1974643 RepID=A0A2M8FA30_9BACT|nr:MAG: hypothetical protein COU34_03475 [Candidatus Magasanikbacteria bacterium CG10_big_fil_rev_8_21_14_0_10_43_9]PIY92130.1 MAG: hypothetical protein COY70_04855 [Candidatus Magasanikbacteria bacterium CG_4_10_14_0_8_um_filter_42_12]PJC52604.1 MAG: hypothetical protein CO030_01970 [Candidatus Magasanikbacteria bacterium CG_4_9_14_0_2_um_filter_42_11]